MRAVSTGAHSNSKEVSSEWESAASTSDFPGRFPSNHPSGSLEIFLPAPPVAVHSCNRIIQACSCTKSLYISSCIWTRGARLHAQRIFFIVCPVLLPTRCVLRIVNWLLKRHSLWIVPVGQSRHYDSGKPRAMLNSNRSRAYNGNAQMLNAFKEQGFFFPQKLAYRNCIVSLWKALYGR